MDVDGAPLTSRYLQQTDERSNGPVGCGGPRRDHRPGGLVVMSPSAPTSRRPPKVLLVDDSGDTRRALRELLEAQAITIVGEAAEGAEGIDLARKLMPDVVLMDLKMPGIDGIEATKIITSSLPDTHVIVLTTFDDDSLRQRADEAGAAAYLVKAGSPELIIDAIFQALGS
jgi:DNA-binding NarL/FixJ family response regulator